MKTLITMKPKRKKFSTCLPYTIWFYLLKPLNPFSLFPPKVIGIKNGDKFEP